MTGSGNNRHGGIITEVLQRETERTQPDMAHKKIEEAKKLFISMGLEVSGGGFISNNISPKKLAELHEWHESTRGKGGIDMPTEDSFYEKVYLAVSLWPQREDTKINYLLGKGVGVEVALRGTVVGREKRKIVFPYRTHSDFELYGVDYENETSEQTPSLAKPVYTPGFKQVFGAQEYYPPTKTKGLKDIPPGLLYKTAESVDLGGVRVLVPKLELLFLDKWMAQETTPRAEGNDAELLARQYSLDKDELHEYLQRFVVEPRIKSVEADGKVLSTRHLSNIERYLIIKMKSIEEPTKENMVASLNTEIAQYLSIDPNVSISGISGKLWIPLSADQIDEGGKLIDQSYIDEVNRKVETQTKVKIEKINNFHTDLDKFLSRVAD